MEFQEILEIPRGCTPTIEKGIVSIRGEKGEVQKDLFNPIISLKVETNGISLSTKSINKKSKKIINTYKAHIKNLCKGVIEGHIYKLKICSGHFPMTVTVKDNSFEIKNFIGEKVPRTLKITEGVSVKIEGTNIIVEGINKEHTGQMAASIERLTRRPGFDKRIFQDGIYMTEKDGKIIK